MKTLRVHLVREVDTSYDIVIDAGLLGRLAGELAEDGPARRHALICDSNTRPLFGDPALRALSDAGMAADLIEVPAGEQRNNFV